MLLKRKTLERIRSGEITLAFRRWKRPTVRGGGGLTTVIGILAIDAVRVVTLTSISEEDSKRAGFAGRKELVAELRGRAGKVYRIELRLAGADPRIGLGEKEKLSAAELDELRRRLDRMDSRSADGTWTARVLDVIRVAPAVRAADLAAKLGMEKTKFKQRVRKLKALGLTESLEVGYRLSPRGRAAWQRLN